MKLEDIQKLWEADGEIDRVELGYASLDIAKLHNKYYKIMSTERLGMRRRQEELKAIIHDKTEWLMGTIDEGTMRKHGWDPNPRRIVKSDINRFIDADPQIIQLKLDLAYWEEKVKFVESILQTIHYRGHHIRAAIDWERFKVGS